MKEDFWSQTLCKNIRLLQLSIHFQQIEWRPIMILLTKQGVDKMIFNCNVLSSWWHLRRCCHCHKAPLLSSKMIDMTASCECFSNLKAVNK